MAFLMLHQTKQQLYCLQSKKKMQGETWGNANTLVVHPPAGFTSLLACLFVSEHQNAPSVCPP